MKKEIVQNAVYFFVNKTLFKNTFQAHITSTENMAKPPLTRETSQTTKTSFSYTSPPTRGDITSYVNDTINTSSLKSNVNEATIMGASIAGIVALTFGFFLVVCLLKRRRLH